MPSNISQVAPHTITIRTATGAIWRADIAVDLDYVGPERADVLIIHEHSGRRSAAVLIGQTYAASEDLAEIGTVVRACLIDPEGEHLGCLIDAHHSVDAPHDWGSLGLPNGLETPVAAARRPIDHVALARNSASHRAVERDAILSLVPGDMLRLGATRGELVGIDRRAGTADIVVDGDVETMRLNALAAISETEEMER